jgi:hypothetical protein
MRLPIATIFLLFSIASYSQEIRKFRATDLMMKWEDDKEWGDLNPCDVLIVMADKRITIYSKEEQQFDYYSYGAELESPDDPNNLCRELKCIDHRGQKCTVFIYRKADEGRVYLISVMYQDLWYAYSVKEL